MEETTRKFKQPKSLVECENCQCRECAAMCDILMFSYAGWKCYDMRKALKYQKAIAPREKY